MVSVLTIYGIHLPVFVAKKADRHLPTMTVEETFKFAFDSMCGGTHGQVMGEGSESFSDEQKDLVSWMDSKYFKVTTAACT